MLAAIVQANCLLCGNKYTDPVETICGHVFCLRSIKKFTETWPDCPICGAQLYQRPDLRPQNTPPIHAPTPPAGVVALPQSLSAEVVWRTPTITASLQAMPVREDPVGCYEEDRTKEEQTEEAVKDELKAEIKDEMVKEEDIKQEEIKQEGEVKEEEIVQYIKEESDGD